MAAKGLEVQGVYGDGLALLNGMKVVSDVVRSLEDVLDVGAAEYGWKAPECGLGAETSCICLE